MKSALSSALKNEIIGIMKNWKKISALIKENSKQIVLSVGIGGFACSLITARYYHYIVSLNHSIRDAMNSGDFHELQFPASIPIALFLSFSILAVGMFLVLPNQNHANIKCATWLCLFFLEIGTVTMTVAMENLFYGYWITSALFCIVSSYILIDLLKAIRIWAKDDSGYDVAKLTLIWAILALIIGKLV